MIIRTGDKVKISDCSSRYHGCTGTVLRTQVRGLAIVYEVSFDASQPGILMPENRFFEYELEPVAC